MNLGNPNDVPTIIPVGNPISYPSAGTKVPAIRPFILGYQQGTSKGGTSISALSNRHILAPATIVNLDPEVETPKPVPNPSSPENRPETAYRPNVNPLLDLPVVCVVRGFFRSG